MRNFIRTMMATVVMAIFCFVGQAVAEITVASWGGAYTICLLYTSDAADE